ncbi:MAG: Rpn family recombination-promoting nuclease/putative transposase [Planctomycetes bacterium]|nr:Rpn family recombination-promoting nuclease/putative transposase [Planctomycetota bacterium]
MKRDSLLFSYFKELPGCFFQLIGRPESDARRYELKAIEYKETAVRLDGVFLPRQPDVDPAYIWEAQHYRSEKVYANLISKIGRFLEHGNPKQDWVAVVIYPNRSLEQENLRPYRCLIDSDQLVRIYQDELPPALPDQFELGVLELIAAKPEIALEKAKAMVPRVRASKRPPQFQKMVIQFVETVILYQFPSWSRKEIEKMSQVSDVRQTRVYQEGVEEGIEKVALNLLKTERPIKEIAELTGLSLSQIRKLKKKLPKI